MLLPTFGKLLLQAQLQLEARFQLALPGQTDSLDNVADVRIQLCHLAPSYSTANI